MGHILGPLMEPSRGQEVANIGSQNANVEPHNGSNNASYNRAHHRGAHTTMEPINGPIMEPRIGPVMGS
jgi:hypothetical protein